MINWHKSTDPGVPDLRIVRPGCLIEHLSDLSPVIWHAAAIAMLRSEIFNTTWILALLSTSSRLKGVTFASRFTAGRRVLQGMFEEQNVQQPDEIKQNHRVLCQWKATAKTIITLPGSVTENRVRYCVLKVWRVAWFSLSKFVTAFSRRPIRYSSLTVSISIHHVGECLSFSRHRQ